MTAAERALQGVGSTMDVNVCASALRLMSQLLNWEFQGTLVRGANGIVVSGKNKANAFTSSIGREAFTAKRPGEHASLVQVKALICSKCIFLPGCRCCFISCFNFFFYCRWLLSIKCLF